MKRVESKVRITLFALTILVAAAFVPVAEAGRVAPSSRYMGGPAELVTAPTGAIINKEVMEQLAKTAWTNEPEIENPVEGAYLLRRIHTIRKGLSGIQNVRGQKEKLDSLRGCTLHRTFSLLIPATGASTTLTRPESG